MNRRSFLARGLKAAAGLAAMVALPQSVGTRDEPDDHPTWVPASDPAVPHRYSLYAGTMDFPEPDALVMENIHSHDNGWAGISTFGTNTIAPQHGRFDIRIRVRDEASPELTRTAEWVTLHLDSREFGVMRMQSINAGYAEVSL